MTWITIPNVFGGKGGQRVPVSQEDDNWQYLADKLNLFNPTGSPAGPGGIYGVRNLVGQNNAGAPTTTFDLSADAWLLRNPTDGSFIVVTNTGTLSNDTSVAGPTANGRDQAAAFANSTWIHVYAIYNPTSATLATLSSTVAPPTGPALPSGFTMWGYSHPIRKDGGGNLVRVLLRGSSVIYNVASQVVTGGAPAINTETAVSLLAIVPPNALRTSLVLGAAFFNGSTSGTDLIVRVITGESVVNLRGTVFAGSGAPITAQVVIPNVLQQYLYLWQMDVPNIPTFATDQYVSSYTVPNGGE